MNHNIIYIVIAWSLLAFVGYNVLSAEASEEKDCRSISEPDDDIYCKEFDWSAFYPDRESVEAMCDASEDYAKNPNNCDKAYDLVEKAEAKTGFLAKDYDWREFYDDEISRESVEERCDASEDYEANKKACDKAYDLIEKQEKSTIESCEAGGKGKYVINGYNESCVGIEKGKPIVLDEWMNMDTPDTNTNTETVPEEEPAVIEDWSNEVEQPDYAESFKIDYSDEEKEESDDNDVPKEEDVHTLFEDELEREDVDKYCDASEDYAKHPTECNKLYSIVEKREEDSRQYNQELQKICEDVGAEWKDGVCDTNGDDGKANQFHEKSLLIDAE